MVGLPQGALVLCAFTNTYKINPPMYEVWMRLLRELPESVLWLRAVGEPARGQDVCCARRSGAEVEGRATTLILCRAREQHERASGSPGSGGSVSGYCALQRALDGLRCAVGWGAGAQLCGPQLRLARSGQCAAPPQWGLPELVTESLQQYELWRWSWDATGGASRRCVLAWRPIGSVHRCSIPAPTPERSSAPCTTCISVLASACLPQDLMSRSLQA